MSLAQIHIAKKDLGLEDDDYRAVLERVTGKTSSAVMTPGERGRVLDEFRRLGWTPQQKRKGLDGPFAKKVQALWIAGWNLGLIRDRRDSALIAFVKRQTGIDHTRWLVDSGDAAKVIEALKGWLAREGGVEWTKHSDPRDAVLSAQLRELAALNLRPSNSRHGEIVGHMHELGVFLRNVGKG
ncbi:phage gp16-like protein [Rhodobium orientis]|uniref:GemA protein n=1 Tax=Rhodobium orientis TaxID=34017 RepID=A0A327JU76_9HYPH|nr:regulatory protein GemA [Rhodobium orientis]MBB4302327.1 phage gp16-like protein [Rhodobium orientis]MBK5949033.1 hypothetical protein [Rhodobium orientis]RAI29023.1 hypothetical protein CH339_04900 [Rhodobium orientis]